jgi:hypothetical protein
VDSGWAAHAHCLIPGRMNVERLIFFFALEGRLRDSGWAAHAQRRRSNRMNVGASYMFCVGGPTAWIQAGLHARSAGRAA